MTEDTNERETPQDCVIRAKTTGGEPMTPEDKRLIAEYMGWMCPIIDQTMPCIRLLKKNYKIVNFDLNDAGLCVEKMREKGDWPDFYFYFVTLKVEPMERSIFEMFNARNFFSAMAAYLKEGKK
jgi:hypothetical protein